MLTPASDSSVPVNSINQQDTPMKAKKQMSTIDKTINDLEKQKLHTEETIKNINNEIHVTKENEPSIITRVFQNKDFKENKKLDLGKLEVQLAQEKKELNTIEKKIMNEKTDEAVYDLFGGKDKFDEIPYLPSEGRNINSEDMGPLHIVRTEMRNGGISFTIRSDDKMQHFFQNIIPEGHAGARTEGFEPVRKWVTGDVPHPIVINPDGEDLASEGKVLIGGIKKAIDDAIKLDSLGNAHRKDASPKQ